MKNVEASTADQSATVAEQDAPVAPKKAPSKKGATQKNAAPKAKQTAKGAKAAPKKGAKLARAQKGADPERTNKKAEIIALMKRPKGVTLAEIMEVTGWQKHTVRGFCSILGSKGGHTVESSKNAAGERSYRITK